MGNTTVTFNGAIHQRIDMRWMHHAILQDCSAKQTKKLSLFIGNQSVEVGELFDIKGKLSSENLILENSNSKFDYVGYSLPTGMTLTVTQECGHYAGAELAGGHLIIQGNTQHYTGCAMSKGAVKVTGNCGNYVGGAYAGQKKGMSGGLILTHGNTGDFTGDLMRRGTIMVTGNIGNHCASRMIAGTITNLGSIGKEVGIGMRRGTLLLPKLPKNMNPGFQNCGRHNLGYLTLLLHELRICDSAFQALHPMRRRVQRYLGDSAVGGLAEILIWIG